jgi:hypothetical protein
LKELLLVVTLGQQLRSDGVDGHDVDMDVFGGQFGSRMLGMLVFGVWITDWREFIAICFLV